MGDQLSQASGTSVSRGGASFTQLSRPKPWGTFLRVRDSPGLQEGKVPGAGLTKPCVLFLTPSLLREGQSNHRRARFLAPRQTSPPLTVIKRGGALMSQDTTSLSSELELTFDESGQGEKKRNRS